MKKAVLWKEDQWGLDILGIEGKEGRGRSHEVRQGATGGDKLGRSWRSKSIIEGRDGDLLKI